MDAMVRSSDTASGSQPYCARLWLVIVTTSDMSTAGAMALAGACRGRSGAGTLASAGAARTSSAGAAEASAIRLSTWSSNGCLPIQGGPSRPPRDIAAVYRLYVPYLQETGTGSCKPVSLGGLAGAPVASASLFPPAETCGPPPLAE